MSGLLYALSPQVQAVFIAKNTENGSQLLQSPTSPVEANDSLSTATLGAETSPATRSSEGNLPESPLADGPKGLAVVRTTQAVPHSSAHGELSAELPEVLRKGVNFADFRSQQPPEMLPFASLPKHFCLFKYGPENQLEDAPTLLVVGGIQGDEPGGFSAASLLSTHYTFTKGQVWVVPDLNFMSILQRGRGIFGDMNRKFAHLDKNDPEFEIVQRIKSVILDEDVDLILNLHDGSGFYRPTFEGANKNPKRWGQSVIIDQEEIDAPRFNKLKYMAERAEQDANKGLVSPEHRYHTRNTNTRNGDKEMEKSLSFFAVINGKPAFGVEASKDFTTEYRSYYHLLVIESFMKQMGIEFKRDFALSPKGVLAATNSNLKLTAFSDRVVFPLENVRPVLRQIPFKKECVPDIKASRPLLSMVEEGASWRIAYGNRTLTRVQALPMPFDDSLEAIAISLDGNAPQIVKFGEIVYADADFMVQPLAEYRVNAIGAVKDKNGTEAGVSINKKDFRPEFSVDTSGMIYRVEVYKENAFAGMVLVSFDKKAGDSPTESLTAVKGPESEFGY